MYCKKGQGCRDAEDKEAPREFIFVVSYAMEFLSSYKFEDHLLYSSS